VLHRCRQRPAVRLVILILTLLTTWPALPAPAGAPPAAPLRLAVASSVRAVAEQLASAYTAMAGQPVTISSGASGVLYAQIRAGAPFDLFMAADADYPVALAAAGLGLEPTLTTYAIGRLVVLCDSPCAGLDVEAMARRLMAARRIAIANPEIAPYGRAALDFLVGRGLIQGLRDRLVYGNNAAQAYQFYHTGHADFAIVSGAQAVAPPDRSQDQQAQSQRVWEATGYLDRPIMQQLVVLSSSPQPGSATGFVDFVDSRQGRAILSAAGYLPVAEMPESP